MFAYNVGMGSRGIALLQAGVGALLDDPVLGRDELIEFARLTRQVDARSRWRSATLIVRARGALMVDVQ